MSLLQRAASDDVIGRVSDGYDQLNVGAIAIGSAVAGALAATVRLGWSVPLVTAACALVTTMAARGRTEGQPASL